MKGSNFKLKLGNWEVQGIWAIILGIIILIPILGILGFVLSVIFSIVGVVLTVGVGVALIGAVIAIIALIIPRKWSDKLGLKVNINKETTTKPKKTENGKPIVDVDFKEEK